MKEGYKNIDTIIEKTGDVMQDAANFYAQKSEQKSTIIKELNLDKYILTTLHRAENTDDKNRLSNIVEALNQIHQTICPIVLPLHPRTKKKLDSFGLKLNVKLINPVGYFDMIELIKNSSLVMTDSGGLQKEAFFFKKNCVTMRDQTEWIELIIADVNVLVGADMNQIINKSKFMLNKTSDFTVNLYGNGMASKNIIETIIK
jgi:UDP-GlcNAc3NAcA epimerase